MPDRRKHRGPHPEDSKLFAAANVPQLCQATSDLSWLLSRGYASTSSIKLVGDRFGLDARQRIAIARSGCADDNVERRRSEVSVGELAEQELWIDGFNLLTTIEAALAGGVILRGRDGCYRDMASMHGSYKKVEETRSAIELIGETIEPSMVKRCHWLLDQPVSNSGRLAALLRETAAQRGWAWEAELVPDPDVVLKESRHVVVSADSQILNHAPRWCNLAGAILDAGCPDAWIIDLS